jgi:hypothetical protein
MIDVYCQTCRTVAKLGGFMPEIADYVLTCGHLYYKETSAEHSEMCVVCLTGYDCPELDALEASEVTA